MMFGLSKRQILPFLFFQQHILLRYDRKLFKIPTHTAYIEKQRKLGYEIFKELLKELVRSEFFGCLTNDGSYKGLRPVAIDGSKENVADTEANDDFFGRLRPEFAYPQMLHLALLDVSTRLPLDVEVSPTKKGSPGETRLSHRVIMNSIEKDMLVLLDRGLPSCETIDLINLKGAFLVARVSSKWKLKPVKILKDGSYIAYVRNRYGRNTKKVRVIEYEINIDGKLITARLITTLFNCKKYPAKEIVKLYSLRWEIEISFNEIDNKMLAKRISYKSKTPETNLIEVYCTYLAYFVIRIIMLNACKILNLRASQLSFIYCLQMIRTYFCLLNFIRKNNSAEITLMNYVAFLNILGAVQNNHTKNRRNKRVVKNRNVKYNIKKPGEEIKLPPISINITTPT